MGHYLGEVESADQTEERISRAREVEELHAAGYYSVHAVSGVIAAYPPEGGIQFLYLHKPCGQPAFDPDTHDRYCPARRYEPGADFLDEVSNPANRSGGATF